jgi:hypothetical protein
MVQWWKRELLSEIGWSKAARNTMENISWVFCMIALEQF